MPARACIILAGLALLGSAFAPVVAQAPVPLVHATYPPAPEDRTPLGTEKFVVFGIDGEMTSAWEYVPGAEPPRLVKRVDFARSRRTAKPVDRQVAPDFVQLKIRTTQPRRTHGRRVFHIDYRAWQVRCVADETESFRIVGRSRSAFYLEVNDALRLFDPTTGKLEEPKRPFHKVHDLGRYWLVWFEGDASPRSFHVFDPEKRETVAGARVAPPGGPVRYESDDPREFLTVSPDGRRVAWLGYLDWKEMAKHLPVATVRMESSVRVVDLENGRDRTLPIAFFGVTMSGKWNIKHTIGLAFPSPNELTYLSVRPGAEWSFWSGLQVALEAGSVDRVSVTFEPFGTRRRLARPDDLPEAREDREGVTSIWVPPYLASMDFPIEDRASLFEAFLERHRERVSLPPKWRPMAYEFSSDGRRFLAFTRRGLKPGRVFFGDLEKDVLLPVEGKVAGWTIVRRVRMRDGGAGGR